MYLRTGQGVLKYAVFAVCVLFWAACAHHKPHPRMEVVRQAVESYVGTPYRYGGVSREGVDCSGLVRAVYLHAGLNLPHSVERQYEMGKKVKRRNLRYGDVIFFNTKPWAGAGACVFPCIMLGASVPMVYGRTHNGIYTGYGSFVHAGRSRGVVRERLDNDYWEKRYIEARRYLE